MGAILGSNFLLSNAVKGIADPSVGYTNGKSIAEVQARVHSDGALYQMNNGQGGDTFAFSVGNGSAIFATDGGDTVNLKGNWTDANQYVQDSTTGIWGKLYTDDKGEKALISGGGTISIDNAPPPAKDGMTKDKVDADIKVMEEFAGTTPDGLLTQKEIQNYIDSGKLQHDGTADDKAFWMDVVNNWDSTDVEKDGRHKDGLIYNVDVEAGAGMI